MIDFGFEDGLSFLQLVGKGVASGALDGVSEIDSSGGMSVTLIDGRDGFG